MNETKAKEIVDKVIGQIFGFQNPLTLDQVYQKFAFDVRLPQQVYDSTTNQPTWAQSTNPTKFITMQNAWDKQDRGEWDVPKHPLNNLQDILTAWNAINFTATERQIDSQNVAKSDNIYFSENVYRSVDVHRSKNIVFSDAAIDSEFIVATQRSNTSSFCMRLEDSQKCSNSFSVSWSEGVVNSFFIHDSKDVQDSIFCSHVTGKRFCVANMQFEEEDYKKIKNMVIRWVLTG
jgi:hypothetical protein